MVYEFSRDIPLGLIPKLIVRTREFSYKKNWHWISGCILKNKDEDLARIRTVDRRCYIEVQAVYAPNLLGYLSTILEATLKFWPGVKYTKSIPCGAKLERIENF